MHIKSKKIKNKLSFSELCAFYQAKMLDLKVKKSYEQYDLYTSNDEYITFYETLSLLKIELNHHLYLHLKFKKNKIIKAIKKLIGIK